LDSGNVSKPVGTSKSDRAAPLLPRCIGGIINRYRNLTETDLPGRVAKFALQPPPNEMPRSLNRFISKELGADAISRND
jgi:hypothetical protein